MKKLPATRRTTLARKCFVTTIHGITGQAIDEGYLAAGSLAKNIETETTEDGPLTFFLASTDKGKTWWRVTTFENPRGLFTTTHTDPRFRLKKMKRRLSRVGFGKTHRSENYDE